MNYDYFVELAGQRIEEKDTSRATVAYHRLVARQEKREKDQANELRQTWAQSRIPSQRIDTDDLPVWPAIRYPEINLSLFPRYSLFLRFPFRLGAAYLSKDEQDFYILDNPVRRDRTFGLPYVAPTSWKGSLRSALWKLGYKGTHPGVRRLLGNEREEETDFQAGNLRFFPSFFTRQSLEIINPHDRERRVGKNPILFESVPARTTSVFSLLYVPVDRQGTDEEETRKNVAQDLKLVAEGLEAMLFDYGFGAKTSSGYGVIERDPVPFRDITRDDLPNGWVGLRAVLGLPERVHRFEEEYGTLDSFSPEEWEVLLSSEELVEYQAVKAAYAEHQRNVEAQQIIADAEGFEAVVSQLETWAADLRRERADA
jgi:CRISPR-associated protein Cmr2